jgi:DNA-binding transcriptional ArsR family regulator
VRRASCGYTRRVDSLITAAARALRAGDPLSALKQVALRDDAPALALRGIAMAQLGELGRARLLLRRAARRFGPAEVVERARCASAEAEVALASRELSFPAQALDAAIRTFEARGQRENALHARLLRARRWLLIGELERAEAALAEHDLAGAPPMLATVGELVTFDVALRRGRVGLARAAAQRARAAARRARIPALSAEVDRAAALLDAPAARLVREGVARTIDAGEVEAVRASACLVVDACRRSVSHGPALRELARRPVLFALLRALAETFPAELSRDALVAAGFGARRATPSLRARLRVELGRLRRELRSLATVRATPNGFVLVPHATEVLVLAPPIEGVDAALLALLGDGAAWSTSALALALGSSQRSVQRALSVLEKGGHVRALGRGRARRWVALSVSGFTTALLLPAPVAIG